MLARWTPGPWNLWGFVYAHSVSGAFIQKRSKLTWLRCIVNIMEAAWTGTACTEGKYVVANVSSRDGSFPHISPCLAIKSSHSQTVETEPPSPFALPRPGLETFRELISMLTRHTIARLRHGLYGCSSRELFLLWHSSPQRIPKPRTRLGL